MNEKIYFNHEKQSSSCLYWTTYLFFQLDGYLLNILCVPEKDSVLSYHVFIPKFSSGNSQWHQLSIPQFNSIMTLSWHSVRFFDLSAQTHKIAPPSYFICQSQIVSCLLSIIIHNFCLIWIQIEASQDFQSSSQNSGKCFLCLPIY